MGLGWATEAAAGGGMDAVGKLIEQRMAMARDAETVRSNMAREKQAADALAENTAYRHDVFGAQQADRDITTGVNLGKSLSPGDDVTSIAPVLRKGGQGPNMSAPAYTPMPAAAPPASLADPTQDQTAPMPAATGGGPYVPNAPSLASPNVTKRISWLGTPQERVAKQKETDSAAFVRALPPGAEQDDAQYQLQMGHPRPPDRDALAADRAAAQQDNIRLAASLRNPPQADRSRLDHSYTEQTKRLDAIEKPLADQADRIARLRQTIDQNSPQADTLIAPELLIAMAGGAGTGLRINEAEIERVVGGKNQWEKLKSALGAWQADPTKPFAVTPEQRVQMQTLIKVVGERGQQRLKMIDDARGQLLDATDVTAHRRTLDHLKKALNDESAGSGGTVAMTSPDGRSLNVPAAKVAELEAAGAVRVKQ